MPPAAAARRARHPSWSSLLTACALAVFVVGVYVLVVVGGGAVLGRTSTPSVPLSVLATAVVALAFERVRQWAETVAARLLRRGGSTPYDVLSRFSETVTGGYATEELPDRMVRLLAEGTDARWAQVWLVVQDQLVLAASWPADEDSPLEPPQPAGDGDDLSGPGRRAVTVRHAGQVYGVFRLQERDGATLTSVEQRLFAGLAAQAGLVLRLVGLRADLAARHADLAERAAELQLSRERLIETQDDERRRLERDIHDGAQQHLVALAVNLRLVEAVAAKDPERAAGILAAQADAAREAIETVSRLSSGMYPRHLADHGLAAALRAAVAGTSVPVVVSDDDFRRLPEDVEAALYFFAMEAVQNAAKHSEGTVITVRLATHDGQAHVTVVDDGLGFDPSTVGSNGSAGTGLSNMQDRIEAVRGTLAVGSAPGHGSSLTATVPVPAAGSVV
jgi:signal transduction histidine kinase